MRPGEIYKLYMRYKPPAQGGKERPALVMTTNNGNVIAILVKATGSKPTQRFPNRIPLFNWRNHATGLTKPSYAEIDTIMAIHSNTRVTYSGELHPHEGCLSLPEIYRILIARINGIIW